VIRKGREARRREAAGRAARVVAGAVALAALGCGRTPAAGDPGGGTMGRSGCAPGATALEPRTLAQGLFSGLAWNDGAVVATGLDGLTSFPTDGSASTTIAHMSESNGLVLAGGSAFFTASVPAGAPDPQGKVSTEPGLFSVALTGGDPTLALSAFVNLDGAVTDGKAIYAPGAGGGVMRFAVADGARTDLVLPTTFSIDALAVFAGTVYVAAQDLGNTTATNGVIVKLPATGGAIETVASNIGHPWSLAADASGLYWVEEAPIGQFGDAHVVHAGLDGQGKKTLLTHGASSLVLSDGALFLASDGISKLPLAGGAEVPLVTGLQGPGRLVVANGNAAWVDPEFPSRSATTMPSLMTTCW
jgi:hypothetical protein